MNVGHASYCVKVGVDHVLVERDVGWGGAGRGLASGECSNFIGADGGIDRGLNRNGSGEGEHEGGWISEIVDESSGCLGNIVFVGPKDPLLLLLVDNVGKTSVSGDTYW